MRMNKHELMRATEYVAMQCYGCSDSEQILTYKSLKVMKYAVAKKENPYKALNDFLGTDISEEVLKNL